MLPVQVTIRDIPNSQALENHIKERAQKLSQYYQRIISCKVVIELAQKHKHQGKLYSVNIAVAVPGKELVVNHKKDEDVYIAVRDAFHAIERQLEKYVQRRRGEIKSHDNLNRGYITRILSSEGYGFIHSVDGNEYYFSAANVAHPQFDKLEIGDYVEFLEVQANEGLQANRVKLEKRVSFSGDEDNLH